MRAVWIVGASLACVVCLAMARAPGSSALPAPADRAGEPVDQVLLRVKQEIGLFQAEAAAWSPPARPVCGNGNVNFRIKSVRIELATVIGRSAEGEAGMKIPFGPAAAGEVGPSVKGSFDYKGTSTLDYTYHVPDEIGRTDPESTANIRDSAVIAPTLARLREGLIKAASQLPCMKDTPADKDDSFAFAFELTRDVNPKVGFNFLIVSASAGVGLSQKRSNAITVTFHPMPTGDRGLR